MKTKKSPAPAGLFYFLAAAVFFSAPAAAQIPACRNSICFENSKKIGTEALPVRGLAHFEYLFLDAYTAALYSPPGTSAADILENIPKSLILHYHRSVKKEWMLKAARDRLVKNPEVDLSSLEERLQQINSVYEDVKKGDRYELRYDPQQGTSLYLNGRFKILIPGEDFQRAYFGIWLSEKPISRKFRDQFFSETKEAP